MKIKRFSDIYEQKEFARSDYRKLDPFTKRFKRKKRNELANFLRKKRKEINEGIKAERKDRDLESIKYRNNWHESYLKDYKSYGNGKNKNNQYSTEQRSRAAERLNKWRNSNNKLYEDDLDYNKQQEMFDRDLLYDTELFNLNNHKDYINKETKKYKESLNKKVKRGILAGSGLLLTGLGVNKLHSKRKKKKEEE